MNILFASPEVTPFAKTGGLADVSGSLPKALSRLGCNVTTILPLYRSVRALELDTKPFSHGPFRYQRYAEGGIEYLFVDNDAYYDRDNLYGEAQNDYPDNHLRFSHFCRAISALLQNEQKRTDLIHCNDWQTGLAPLYLRLNNLPQKTLFTIHNIGYQGLFDKDVLEDIGVPKTYYTVDGIEYYKKISFLKAGIVYASAISTVSKGYSEEILTPAFGCGMDGILKTRSSDIYGIVNGVDYTVWNPEIDPHIACTYTDETLEKKAVCKKDLMQTVGFSDDALSAPLIGVISRLAEQKGIDLIVEAAKELVDTGAYIIILGTGDERYNKLCREIAELFPERIASYITFDNQLAHKIEAGSDMFIMPSRYEPCGLNQLYSMRYGTVPVVRTTGGLDDTVTDLDGDREHGNGIKFPDATKEALVGAVQRAIGHFKKTDEWRAVQKRIMKLDFSWKASALQYADLYKSLLATNIDREGN
jgi:starch synthase